MDELITVQGVKCYIDKNGTVQLNLEDIARGLGFVDNSKGIEYVKWDRVRQYLADLNFSTEVSKDQFVPENIFYRLAMKAKNETAERFQAKVADEILPAIRKHGGYLTPAKIEEVLLNPDTIIRLATDLKAEREKRKQLETEIEDQKPKVLFADAVTSSKSSVLVGELAKILKQNGIEIGQNRLFEWLREEGYLCKSGENYNLPTQYSMELELMEIKKVTINNPDGSSRITRTPKITGKGQVYFVNKFLNNQLLSTGTTG